MRRSISGYTARHDANILDKSRSFIKRFTSQPSIYRRVCNKILFVASIVDRPWHNRRLFSALSPISALANFRYTFVQIALRRLTPRFIGLQ